MKVTSTKYQTTVDLVKMLLADANSFHNYTELDYLLHFLDDEMKVLKDFRESTAKPEVIKFTIDVDDSKLNSVIAKLEYINKLKQND